MREHWSDKQAGQILGISNPGNVHNSLKNARRKYALLGAADLEKTIRMLLEDVAELRMLQQIEAMEEREISEREARLNGRISTKR